MARVSGPQHRVPVSIEVSEALAGSSCPRSRTRATQCSPFALPAPVMDALDTKTVVIRFPVVEHKTVFIRTLDYKGGYHARATGLAFEADV